MILPSTTLTDGELLLRPLQRTDRDALYEAVGESLTEVSPGCPGATWAMPLSETEHFIESCITAWLQQTYYPLAIFDAATGRYFGGTGVNHIDRANRMGAIGLLGAQLGDAPGHRDESGEAGGALRVRVREAGARGDRGSPAEHAEPAGRGALGREARDARAQSHRSERPCVRRAAVLADPGRLWRLRRQLTPSEFSGKAAGDVLEDVTHETCRAGDIRFANLAEQLLVQRQQRREILTALRETLKGDATANVPVQRIPHRDEGAVVAGNDEMPMQAKRFDDVALGVVAFGGGHHLAQALVEIGDDFGRAGSASSTARTSSVARSS